MSRTASKQQLIVPECFSPEQLPSGLGIHADEARYLLDIIGEKHRHHAIEKDGYVRLQTGQLNRVIDPRRFRRLRRALVQLGLIEVDETYAPGSRSIGYRLKRRCLDSHPQVVEVVNPIVRDKLSQLRAVLEKQQERLRRPIHDLLVRAQGGLSLEGDPEPILSSACPHARLTQSAIVEQIRSGDLPFSVGPTCGRVFNALSGLKRELRPLLRLDGKPVASVDLSCSQPALLALCILEYMDHRGRHTYAATGSRGGKGRKTYSYVVPCSLSVCDPPEDVVWFKRLVCEDGFDLYEHLAEKTGKSRDEVKQRVLADVFAPKRHYPSPVRDAFESDFPSVARYIATRNSRDHGTLIRELQRRESNLVIHTVVPRIIQRFPVVTLHDAVFCRWTDIAEVEAAFQEVFQEIGFSMRLKRELW